jgi:hypothetical protein
MADITMCKGQDCPLRESCYRYTAQANPFRQSYFMTEHMDENDECPEWVDSGVIKNYIGIGGSY